MINITIAGISFGIKTTKRAAMLRIMETNYQPFLATETQEPKDPMLFTVDLDRRLTFQEEEPLKTFGYDLADDKALLRIYPGRYTLSILNLKSGKTFSIECPLQQSMNEAKYSFASDLTMQEIAPPRHILDHLLIFAFSVAGAEYGTLLVHASTVEYRGKAVMFLGESGTGKSTHTKMWLESIPGASLLNDDAPAVRVLKDGSICVYGTPWSGKTPCYRNDSYPLAALARIQRAPYNLINKLNPVGAFGAVLPSCLPTLQQDERMLDFVCNSLSSILKSIPVYTLECLPNTDAAKVACGNIFSIP